MPLVHGKGQKAFEHNIKAEMHAGKPQKQSLAIAYAVKRAAMKKAQHHAKGGFVGHNPAHMEHHAQEHETQGPIHCEHCAKGGVVHHTHHTHEHHAMGGMAGETPATEFEMDKAAHEHEDMEKAEMFSRESPMHKYPHMADQHEDHHEFEEDEHAKRKHILMAIFGK